MSDIAIRVQNISKRYVIGDTSSGSLREAFSGFFSKNGSGSTEEFFALRDVSFEIKRGEAMGIIGKNGAGKSTLLKVLSRITEPTTGRIEIDGRVSSLLEVGTGFHPELTGRENVFLNGTILGMKRQEIKAKFDEIVDFSGVEKFLDTPVKRYSSGMKVRLAFAVAAHLEPEILIIDEVLAVGDAEFQRKCLGKMEDVAGEGRTVLFVSHNMPAVRSLCGQAILIHEGEISSRGNTSHIIDVYTSLNSAAKYSALRKGFFDLSARTNHYGTALLLKSLALIDERGELGDTATMGAPIKLSIELFEQVSLSEYTFGVIIKDLSDQWLTSFNTDMVKPVINSNELPDNISLTIPKVYLTEGTYAIDLSITRKGIGRIDYVENVGVFHVVDKGVYKTGYRVTNYFGVFYSEGVWEIGVPATLKA